MDGTPHEVRRTVIEIVRAGLAATPITAVVGELLQTVEDHKRRRRDHFIDELLASLDEEVTDLYDQVSAERVTDLVEHGLRAAEGARSEEKLRLLARIVAAGTDSAASFSQVERAHFLLDLVMRLESPHMRVLTLLGTPPRPDAPYRSLVGGWTTTGISHVLPDLEDLAAVALSSLAAQGLAVNTQQGAMIAAESWGLTASGQWVLQRLRELSAEPNA